MDYRKIRKKNISQSPKKMFCYIFNELLLICRSFRRYVFSLLKCNQWAESWEIKIKWNLGKNKINFKGTPFKFQYELYLDWGGHLALRETLTSGKGADTMLYTCWVVPGCMTLSSNTWGILSGIWVWAIAGKSWGAIWSWDGTWPCDTIWPCICVWTWTNTLYY